MDFDTIMKFLNGPTFVGFLIIFVMLGGYLGWYVFGPAHNAEVKALLRRAELAEKNAADWMEISKQQVEANAKLASNQEVQLAMITAFMTRNGARG